MPLLISISTNLLVILKTGNRPASPIPAYKVGTCITQITASRVTCTSTSNLDTKETDPIFRFLHRNRKEPVPTFGDELDLTFWFWNWNRKESVSAIDFQNRNCEEPIPTIVFQNWNCEELVPTSGFWNRYHKELVVAIGFQNQNCEGPIPTFGFWNRDRKELVSTILTIPSPG